MHNTWRKYGAILVSATCGHAATASSLATVSSIRRMLKPWTINAFIHVASVR